MTRVHPPAHPPGAGQLTEGSIRLRQLTKTFQRRSGEQVLAIDNVSLDVEPGEFLVLLGPSGCGKTTLLRSLAGLEVPTHGEIIIGGRPVFDSAQRLNVAPEDREMGMIFQSYALWPHMTVFDNVAYPLQARGRRKRDIRADVERVLELVGILELAKQYPGQISGGQQQRVALARALVGGTSIMLFDEPLSNVDAKVRELLRLEIKRMHHELKFTAVYVTHDQEEAMALATRIAVLRQGRVEQLGSPQQVYLRPESLSVARFIGQLNEVPGEVEDISGNEVRVKTAIGTMVARPTAGLSRGASVTLGIRPEHLRFVPAGEVNGSANMWRGSVTLPLFLGTRNEHLVSVDGVDFKVSTRGELFDENQAVGMTVDVDQVLVFPQARGSGS
jgi:iron(III) transport system ATP-binding protein